MKERPILMSTPMVRATLREIDPKTQTRRVMKVQPPREVTSAGVMHAPGRGHDGEWSWLSGDPKDCDSWGVVGDEFRCPYGQLGDRIWVRETFDPIYGQSPPDRIIEVDYRADWETHGKHYRMKDEMGARRWKPSIHMPRELSRILLEITGVRVERLQDISERDAEAEGIERDSDGWRDYQMPSTQCCGAARDSYRTLWESINGPGSWAANPWVWCISFRRIQP